MTEQTTRGQHRRERILQSAADLMAERGYPAVSMSSIGSAAGIVGSGVYRHFDSKSTILSTLLERVMARMRDGTHEIVASSLTGVELLDAMIRQQAAIAIANRSLMAVYLRDAGNLEPTALRDLRRQQRQLVEEWIYQCEALSPFTDENIVRTVVQAVLALINSACSYNNPLVDDELLEVVSHMAGATLRAGLALS
ncbi:MAG: TetR family transcriptional regulator [Microbacteriaceae bacterium]|jgi:AcrR family transcriptional regulator|nr:TetR family transcriptional regulator [Microbacteriaceae bacterium]